MISQLQHLKQCRDQIRKSQSWLQKVPIDFNKLLEDLDAAVDKIERRIHKVEEAA